MTLLWLSVFVAVLVWSAIKPHDYPTWILEVLPAIIGLAVLTATYRSFPLTSLSYILILIHAIILMVGGHYTYAEVPLFEGGLFGDGRNNYDKLGHFFQGFAPAIIAREILIRLQVIRGRRWLHFIIISICLALSAVYELIEWGVAMLSGSAADAFLGTQGYVWDTQSDMGWALTGAIMALALLGRLHDRQLASLDNPARPAN